MLVFPQDEKEFREAWAIKVGEWDSMSVAAGIASEHSTSFFLAGRADVARALRDLSEQLQARTSNMTTELHAYADEDKRRRAAESK